MSAMGAEGAVERAVAAGGIGFSALPQPAPLAFDIREIERFRYRVEDTLKKVFVCVGRLEGVFCLQGSGQIFLSGFKIVFVSKEVHDVRY